MLISMISQSTTWQITQNWIFKSAPPDSSFAPVRICSPGWMQTNKQHLEQRSIWISKIFLLAIRYRNVNSDIGSNKIKLYHDSWPTLEIESVDADLRIESECLQKWEQNCLYIFFREEIKHRQKIEKNKKRVGQSPETQSIEFGIKNVFPYTIRDFEKPTT